MSTDKAYEQYAYLTFDDILKLGQNSNQNETLIAIKAPLGSTIELPDPE